MVIDEAQPNDVAARGSARSFAFPAFDERPASVLGSSSEGQAAGGAGPASPVVRLMGVRKRFGALPAVDGISLTIAPGEILGIIGRSGAGKSTLIRCLNGLEKPDEGDVEILGQSLRGIPEASLRRVRSRIGMIFQHFNLLSAKTVAENVALPLKIAGASRAKRTAKVADLLNLVGLDSKAAAYPAQLSGGQKQRVGIARALAADPALLLSDEATSSLDPETTASILALLRDINRKLGLTIVMITHEMSVVRAAAQRVIVLDQGRIVEQGATTDVFASPRTELTRRLIGSSHHSPDAVPSDRIEPAYRPGLYALVRISVIGEAANRPVIGAVAQAYGVEPLILQADIERVGTNPIATFVIAIPEGASDRLEPLRVALAGRLSSFEVLGYARDPV